MRSIRSLRTLNSLSGTHARSISTIRCVTPIRTVRKANQKGRPRANQREVYRREDTYTIARPPGKLITFDSRVDVSVSLDDSKHITCRDMDLAFERNLRVYFEDINDQISLKWRPSTDELVYDQGDRPVSKVFANAMGNHYDALVDTAELVVPHDGLCTSILPIKTSDSVRFEVQHQLAYQIQRNEEPTDDDISLHLDAWKAELESSEYCDLKHSSDPTSSFKLVANTEHECRLFERSHIITADKTILENYLKDFPQLVHIQQSRMNTMLETLLFGPCWLVIEKMCETITRSLIMSEIKNGEQSIGRSAVARYKKIEESAEIGALIAYIIAGIIGIFIAANIIQTRDDLLIAVGIAAAVCGLPYATAMFIAGNCAFPYYQRVF